MSAPTIVLVRGLPGSGKSTLARKFVSTLGFKHYEADMYFLDSDGNYHYDPTQISNAYAWCQFMTRSAIKQGYSVVVSNTFTTNKEMLHYYNIAKNLGVEIDVLEVNGKYQNIHAVPESVIERMRNRWEVLDLAYLTK